MDLQKMAIDHRKIYEFVSDYNLQELEMFLQNGGDPKILLTEDGNSLLHVAASFEDQMCSCNMMKLILRHSANPNQPNNKGETSLHFSARSGHRIGLELLMCNGGDLLRTDITGLTPIDVAYYQGFQTIAEHLTEHLNSENMSPENNGFTIFLWKRKLIECDAPLSNLSSGVSSLSFDSEHSRSTNGQVSFRYFDGSSMTPSFHHSLFTNDSCVFISRDTSQASISDLCNEQFIRNINNSLDGSVNKTAIVDLFEYSVQFQSFLNTAFLQSSFSDIFSTLGDSTLREAITRFTCFPATLGSDQNDNETLIQSTLKSSECQTFITVDEFLYEDLKENVQLIEKRCPGVVAMSGCTQGLNTSKILTVIGNSKMSSENSDVSADSLASLSASIKGLTGEQLREKLKNLGFSPGPVTPSTFQLLQRHYLRLRRSNELNPKICTPAKPVYSKELKKVVDDPSSLDIKNLELIESFMCEPFNTFDESIHWRDGLSKVCFNYLLLDPRVTNNLPVRFMDLGEKSAADLKEHFKSFIESIFYIGKGSRCRPYSHLSEALSSAQLKKSNKKVEKIKAIWTSGHGVISLHIFQNTLAVESWTREASMISSIGLSNLTNRIEGTFYGPASTWVRSKQRQLGSYLLYKAFLLLLLEGERQIRPRDVPTPAFFKKPV